MRHLLILLSILANTAKSQDITFSFAPTVPNVIKKQFTNAAKSLSRESGIVIKKSEKDKYSFIYVTWSYFGEGEAVLKYFGTTEYAYRLDFSYYNYRWNKESALAGWVSVTAWQRLNIGQRAKVDSELDAVVASKPTVDVDVIK